MDSNSNNGDQKPSNFGIHRPKDPAAPQKGSLSEFLPQLENYTPTIPDSVTTYYMNASGLNCSDPRIVRLISIAAQKFISDIANDSLQHCKTRLSAAQGSLNKNQKDKQAQKKYTLTCEDLAPSLNENFGVVVKKPLYFV